MTMHIGEVVIAALEAEGELRVFESELVQDRRLQVVDVNRVLRHYFVMTMQCGSNGSSPVPSMHKFRCKTEKA